MRRGGGRQLGDRDPCEGRGRRAVSEPHGAAGRVPDGGPGEVAVPRPIPLGESRVRALADRHRRRLEHPHGPATHPVAAPAEDDRVNATRQDAWDQSLTLPTMEEPADDEGHRADERYHRLPDNSTPKPLRL